jgi:hypothetical protein
MQIGARRMRSPHVRWTELTFANQSLAQLIGQ